MRTLTRLLLALSLAACKTDDGELTPDDCDEGTVFATECLECGPTDACLESHDICAVACENDGEPCEGGSGFCLGGACLENVCG